MEKQFPSIILAGICLTGKSTLARALMRGTLPFVDFVEGDDLHSEDSIRKMRSGQPLGDLDRKAWLQRIRAAIKERPGSGYRIITCSALSRAFRNEIRTGTDVLIAFLTFDRSSAETRARIRLKENPQHFFQPAIHPALLDGQYRDLEIPGPDEADCLVIDLENFPTGDAGPEVDYEELSRKVSRWLDSAL